MKFEAAWRRLIETLRRKWIRANGRLLLLSATTDRQTIFGQRYKSPPAANAIAGTHCAGSSRSSGISGTNTVAQNSSAAPT